MAIEPIRSSPEMGASKMRAAVMPQSGIGFSPEAGIGAPNQGSTSAAQTAKVHKPETRTVVSSFPNILYLQT
jgi:hypothetical protein